MKKARKKNKLTTTLAAIRDQRPCKYGWRKLTRSLGGIAAYGENTKLPLTAILKSNGPTDTWWVMFTVLNIGKDSLPSKLGADRNSCNCGECRFGRLSDTKRVNLLNDWPA